MFVCRASSTFCAIVFFVLISNTYTTAFNIDDRTIDDKNEVVSKDEQAFNVESLSDDIKRLLNDSGSGNRVVKMYYRKTHRTNENGASKEGTSISSSEWPNHGNNSQELNHAEARKFIETYQSKKNNENNATSNYLNELNINRPYIQRDDISKENQGIHFDIDQELKNQMRNKQFYSILSKLNLNENREDTNRLDNNVIYKTPYSQENLVSDYKGFYGNNKAPYTVFYQKMENMNGDWENVNDSTMHQPNKKFYLEPTFVKVLSQRIRNAAESLNDANTDPVTIWKIVQLLNELEKLRANLNQTTSNNIHSTMNVYGISGNGNGINTGKLFENDNNAFSLLIKQFANDIKKQRDYYKLAFKPEYTSNPSMNENVRPFLTSGGKDYMILNSKDKKNIFGFEENGSKNNVFPTEINAAAYYAQPSLRDNKIRYQNSHYSNTEDTLRPRLQSQSETTYHFNNRLYGTSEGNAEDSPNEDETLKLLWKILHLFKRSGVTEQTKEKAAEMLRNYFKMNSEICELLEAFIKALIELLIAIIKIITF